MNCRLQHSGISPPVLQALCVASYLFFYRFKDRKAGSYLNSYIYSCFVFVNSMLIFFLQLVLLFAITENSDKFLIIMGGDLKV